MTGTTNLRTVAYHPQANGMVERLHRQLKPAVKYHANIQKMDKGATILLGIRAA